VTPPQTGRPARPESAVPVPAAPDPAPAAPDPIPAAPVQLAPVPVAPVPGREPVLPDQSREDTDAGWGEYPEPASDRLYRDRPPHWDDF
jgi:hypothetical protein